MRWGDGHSQKNIDKIKSWKRVSMWSKKTSVKENKRRPLCISRVGWSCVQAHQIGSAKIYGLMIYNRRKMMVRFEQSVSPLIVKEPSCYRYYIWILVFSKGRNFLFCHYNTWYQYIEDIDCGFIIIKLFYSFIGPCWSYTKWSVWESYLFDFL